MKPRRFALAWTLLCALGLLLGFRPGWAEPPKPEFQPPTAAQSFERHFDLKLPKGVRVARYYGEAAPMDPSFAWELTPIHDSFLKSLVKKAGLKAATKDSRPASANYAFPSWWNRKAIEKLPEVYYKDDSALVRVWADRAKKRLFIEFVNL